MGCSKQPILTDYLYKKHRMYECRNKKLEKSQYTIDFSSALIYNGKSAKHPKDAREEYIMGINYKKLWKLLIDKDMTKTDLRMQTDIASSTLSKMSRNEYVSLDVLVRICCVLDCELSDITEIEK